MTKLGRVNPMSSYEIPIFKKFICGIFLGGGGRSWNYFKWTLMSLFERGFGSNAEIASRGDEWWPKSSVTWFLLSPLEKPTVIVKISYIRHVPSQWIVSMIHLVPFKLSPEQLFVPDKHCLIYIKPCWIYTKNSWFSQNV